MCVAGEKRRSSLPGGEKTGSTQFGDKRGEKIQSSIFSCREEEIRGAGPRKPGKKKGNATVLFGKRRDNFIKKGGEEVLLSKGGEGGLSLLLFSLKEKEASPLLRMG